MVTKDRVRSHVRVVFAAVLGLLLGWIPDSQATETKPAVHSQWKYIVVQNGGTPGILCFDDDQAAAQAVLAVFGGTCPGTFDSWLAPWPNGTSINSAPIYDQACTPAEVGGSNGNGYKIHGEVRPFQYFSKWPVTGGCQTSTTPSNTTVPGQFWWYCPGYPEWKIGIPNPPTEPVIPYCWLDTNATPPTKPPRDKCEEPATGCHTEGNPIELSLGIKYQRETDLQDSSASPLAFARSYNSFGAASGAALGTLWRHTYDRSIDAHLFFGSGTSKYSVHVNRPDGSIVTFDNLSGSAFVADADVSSKLVMLTSGGALSGWQFTNDQDTQETYDANGRLISIHYRAGQTHTLSYNVAGKLETVADPFGHQLGFAYNVDGTLQALTDPHGGTYLYAYDTAGRLSSVTAPDSTTRQYLYNESAYTSGANLPTALTGIIDESGTRFATYRYDVTSRGIGSEHAGGAEAITVAYNANGTTTVTDSLGATRTYAFTTKVNVKHTSGITGQLCAECGHAASYWYDNSGRLAGKTSPLGVNTYYQWTSDGRNLLTSEQRSYPGLLRAVTTTWNPTFRLPATITLLNRVKSFTYNSNGNVLSRTLSDSGNPSISRAWTYTYNSDGQVLTEDGPRTDLSDVTTYTYYACATGSECGRVHTITNVLGQVTEFNTYTDGGLPLTVTDPNGIVTTLAYDGRQRVLSRQVGSETTSFSYWPTGLLKRVTLPDSSYLQYAYDAAHRLTSIEDGSGARVEYTLDSKGNRTAENVYDTYSQLARTHTRVFNVLNQLWKDIGAAGTTNVTTVFGYDADGNQTTISAPLSRSQTNNYDGLGRFFRNWNAANNDTTLTLDGYDNITTFRDPSWYLTNYTYNVIGDLNQIANADAGTTTITRDAAGNVLTSTDARGAISSYVYDAKNRPTSEAFTRSGTTDQTISYTYDSGTNGIGRLTGASDASHSMSWTYDARGRTASRSQTAGGITLSQAYGYTDGNLTSITTPSGQSVTYTYNDNHEIEAVTINGTTLLTGATYAPLGGSATGWTWGNGATTTRSYDLDGRVSEISSAGTQTYSYDDASRITAITNTAPGSNWTYGYDVLDRIMSGVGGGITRGWTYEWNGNRRTETGSAPSTYTVSSTSNRYTSISGAIARTYTYDAAGNVLSYANYAATYNNRGRLASVTSGGTTTSYLYNSHGERIRKSNTNGTRYFAYDENGQLLGEYDNTGALIQETIWLGEIPVAVLKPNGAGVSMYYLHTDHLNTPRRITRLSDNAIVWRWDSDPFGTTIANENPSGLGAFSYNLRFPGQYYDQETGLHYNYFREYDAAVGRYLESDPIGLGGGTNTYGYVGGAPLSFSDPLGLAYGDFPPSPPGFNELWESGRFPDGTAYWKDPAGRRWLPHCEDSRHWRHWDKQDKGGKNQGRWPPNSKKMWPLQKKPDKDQSPTDPSGDAPPGLNPADFLVPWIPWELSPVTPMSPVNAPLREPTRVPVRIPLRIPVLP